jgi:glycosyltransferase involved in cell wall biosynthesis
VKPLVSILIPAFNAEKWIGETLRSAIRQTWAPKEIIVVDDGSTDRTLQVAQQLESDEVRVFTQANQGAAAARNAAFSLSRGEYIQWLDADDLLSANKIASQMTLVQQLESKRTLLSCGWGQFLYRYDHATFTPTPLWCDLSPAEWLVRKMGQNLHMQPATWLVSRELTEAAGPWDTTLAVDDDGEYFCRVLLKSGGVRFVRDVRVYYRDSGTGSLSYVGNSDRKREAQWRSMQLHIGYLRSLEDTPRVHSACVKYIQNWLTLFYPERMDLIAEMQTMASNLGGKLEMPRLSWKYSWMSSVFGKDVARTAQIRLPQLKWTVLRFQDLLLFQMAKRKAGPAEFGQSCDARSWLPKTDG